MKKAEHMAVAIMACIMLTGCGIKEREQIEEDKQYVVLSIDDEQLDDEIGKFISGGLTDGGVYFESEIYIAEEDCCFRYEVIDKYSSENAYYYKIKSEDNYYLYRFQMNENGKIKSFIKFRLEG